MLGDGVCWEGVCACKLLPSAQPARGKQVPSLPQPRDATLHPQNTWTWTPVSAWTPVHLETWSGATESSSTPLVNNTWLLGSKTTSCG